LRRKKDGEMNEIQGRLTSGKKFYRERISSKEISQKFVSEFFMNNMSHKIIMMVYAMTAINVLQLSKILNVQPSTIRNTARVLYDNRFIDRRFEVVEFGKGSGKAIYFLDEAGKIYVSGILGKPLNEIKWRKCENLIHSNNIMHTIGLSDIRAAMTDKIYEWRSGKELGWFEFKVENENFLFAPDAFVSIEETEYLYNYFIEYDRSMRSKEFVKKLKNYEAYKKSGRYYEDDFSTYPRVLIITSSERKAKNIASLIESRTKEDIKYYIVGIDKFLAEPFKDLMNKKIDKSVNLI
jgi:hypothetical protein